MENGNCLKPADIIDVESGSLFIYMLVSYVSKDISPFYYFHTNLRKMENLYT